jgi:hypothetical protein
VLAINAELGGGGGDGGCLAWPSTSPATLHIFFLSSDCLFGYLSIMPRLADAPCLHCVSLRSLRTEILCYQTVGPI